MYINPDIESSYKENNLGKTIYDLVLELKPKKVVEFGCLYGYSTVAIGMALKELGEGKLKVYDLFEDYPYKHPTLEGVKSNVEKYGVSEFVEFNKMDFTQWLQNPEKFDLLHLDISNTGDIIFNTYQTLQSQIYNEGSNILFEGGSLERDQIEWMVKYKMTPINSVKYLTKYQVINSQFPSISLISK